MCTEEQVQSCCLAMFKFLSPVKYYSTSNVIAFLNCPQMCFLSSNKTEINYSHTRRQASKHPQHWSTPHRTKGGWIIHVSNPQGTHDSEPEQLLTSSDITLSVENYHQFVHSFNVQFSPRLPRCSSKFCSRKLSSHFPEI